MKKFILTIFLFSAAITLFAQKNTAADQPVKLYYFLEGDTIAGIKDQFGKTIIKPRKYYFDIDKNFTKKPIKDRLIYLPVQLPEEYEQHSFGSMYDRSGKFLFAAFAFDNGPDNFNEGLMRFVKNNKVGFANRKGDIVIDATFDFAGPFNYGIASFCNGCAWETKGEHRRVIGGVWGFINRRGEKIVSTNSPSGNSDQLADSVRYLPYQFSYSPEEIKLLSTFYNEPSIEQFHFVNYYSPLDSLEKKIRYEITERPSEFFPWIQVSAYTFLSKWGYTKSDDLQFLINPVTKEIFHNSYFGEQTPYKKWLRREIKEAKAYSKQHKDAPYKMKNEE